MGNTVTAYEFPISARPPPRPKSPCRQAEPSTARSVAGRGVMALIKAFEEKRRIGSRSMTRSRGPIPFWSVTGERSSRSTLTAARSAKSPAKSAKAFSSTKNPRANCSIRFETKARTFSPTSSGYAEKLGRPRRPGSPAPARPGRAKNYSSSSRTAASTSWVSASPSTNLVAAFRKRASLMRWKAFTRRSPSCGVGARFSPARSVGLPMRDRFGSLEENVLLITGSPQHTTSSLTAAATHISLRTGRKRRPSWQDGVGTR